ncbi:MAG TPA: hypothetical protein PKV55_14885 [Nitrospira sp.]|nr:hypothetical protein [Nitrospira sp.]
MPTAASLRQLLEHVLRDDNDVEAFCIDHFDEVSKRFSQGMERTRKLNILLVQADRLDILEALFELDLDRATNERWIEKIEWEDSLHVPNVFVVTKRRKRRIRDFLLGAVFADWTKRVWSDLSPMARTAALIVVAMLLSGLGVTQFLQRYYLSARGRGGSIRPRQPPGPLTIPPQLLAWPDGGVIWPPIERPPAPEEPVSR